MIFEAILINYQVLNVYIFSYIQSIKPSNRTSVKAHQKYKKKFIRPIISQKINIYICTFNSCVSFLHSYKYAQPKPPLPLSNPSLLLYPTPPAWAGKHCSHCIPAPSSRDKKQKKPSTSVQHHAALLHHNPIGTFCATVQPHPNAIIWSQTSVKTSGNHKNTPREAHPPPNIHATYRKQTRYHTTKLHRTNLQWKGYVCLVHLLFSNGEKGLRRLLAGNN